MEEEQQQKSEQSSLITPKEEEMTDVEHKEIVTDRSSGVTVAEYRNSDLETLTVPSPEIITAQLAVPVMKTEQFRMTHSEVLARITAQAQAHVPDQAGFSHTSMELLHVPIKQSLSSKVTPNLLHQISPRNQDNNASMSEVYQESSSDHKMELDHTLVKSPSADGYNWRKYGQKPVKSHDSSRSYYRCTFVDCKAKKKVERCDHSGREVEIVYKGPHNHDPPQKVRCTKPRKHLLIAGGISSPETVEGSGTMDSPSRKLSGSTPSTPKSTIKHAASEEELHSPKVCALDANVMGEEKCDQYAIVVSKANHDQYAVVESKDDCEQMRAKKRMKEPNVAYTDSLCKIIKEPKIIVQASEDVGISGDGYRWRKYGQKMVKGNTNPRSYYKCTSTGCPVRKHVERATDGTSTFMITYEGKHDHDKPAPRKCHDSQTVSIVTAASTVHTTTNNSQVENAEALTNSESSTQWPKEEKSEVVNEKPSECGGSEKPLDPARTLVSIGIELRPC